jgi:hypothetical protein
MGEVTTGSRRRKGEASVSSPLSMQPWQGYTGTVVDRTRQSVVDEFAIWQEQDGKPSVRQHEGPVPYVDWRSTRTLLAARGVLDERRGVDVDAGVQEIDSDPNY